MTGRIHRLTLTLTNHEHTAAQRVLVPEKLHRYGQRTYDSRLRALVPLFRSHVVGAKRLNTFEQAKDDDAVDIVLRAAKKPLAIGTGRAAAQLAATSIFVGPVGIGGPTAGAELVRLGLRGEFNRQASISIPGRVVDADDVDGFVAEGDPIPFKGSRAA